MSEWYDPVLVLDEQAITPPEPGGPAVAGATAAPEPRRRAVAAADLITLFLERLVGRDADVLAELFAEQIDWYVPGHDAIPWTGSRTKCSDVVARVRTTWSEVEPDSSSVRVDKVLVDGDDAVVCANFAHTFRGPSGGSGTRQDASLRGHRGGRHRLPRPSRVCAPGALTARRAEVAPVPVGRWSTRPRRARRPARTTNAVER